ncbi:MAG: hypothetical protein JSV09_09425 [Thermoplasmata archaeon]|nr:MAG: hypothetical protein JSV09_09425 [Thermoplasmata archaeon]
MKKKEKKPKVKVIEKIPKRVLKYQDKPRRIPREVKKMIEYNWGKMPRPCHNCRTPFTRKIELNRKEELVTVSHKCMVCGSSLKTETLPYPKKVREMVRNSSSLGVKTENGVKLLCVRCNSDRLELIIKPENIDPKGVFVEYACPDCHWGAMLTLNMEFKEERLYTKAYGVKKETG